MEENYHCYNFSLIHFDKGLLDKCIDATYIIHLEGNGRLNDIYYQLNKVQPTKLVYILYNKGYKKCKKTLNEYTPPNDLTDAFLQCFNHSRERGYKNILILEDDFIFNDKIQSPDVINKITQFICSMDGQSFVYTLGTLPYIQMPLDMFTSLILLSVGTHAYIYSDKLQNEILTLKRYNIGDWDLFNNLYVRRYGYREPLCYQTFPDTENSKYWMPELGLGNINRSFIKLFGIDKYPEPGYSIFYFLSIIVGTSLLLFILLFLIMIINNYGKRKILK